MATSYRRPTATASNYKDESAPDSVTNPCVTRPNAACGGRTLLDQFRDKIRALYESRLQGSAHSMQPT
jgi:hypothetical protein